MCLIGEIVYDRISLLPVFVAGGASLPPIHRNTGLSSRLTCMDGAKQIVYIAPSVLSRDGV